MTTQVACETSQFAMYQTSLMLESLVATMIMMEYVLNPQIIYLCLLFSTCSIFHWLKMLSSLYELFHKRLQAQYVTQLIYLSYLIHDDEVRISSCSWCNLSLEMPMLLLVPMSSCLVFGSY